MIFAYLPFTVVLCAILRRVDAFTVVFAFDPLADVGGVVGEEERTVAVRVALTPTAIVLGSICVYYYAFAVGDAGVEASFVARAVGECDETFLVDV